MYILISWMMPVKSQPDLLKKSKYFQIAGNFAEPIEKLIPKDTLDAIKEKTSEVGLTGDDDDEPAAEQKPAETKAMLTHCLRNWRSRKSKKCVRTEKNFRKSKKILKDTIPTNATI